MATKRAKRIDPSEAFASIVGGPVEETAQETAPPVPQPVAEPAAAPQPAEPAQQAAAPQNSAPVAAFAPGAGEGAPAPIAASGAAQAPLAAPAPEQPAPALPKLVQKGYYLREDQAKQLGIYAAVMGADKSSIIRAALSEYFENHPL